MKKLKSFFTGSSEKQEDKQDSSPLKSQSPTKNQSPTNFSSNPEPEIPEIPIEEIDIKAAIPDIAAKFMKECLLVWHDPNVNSQGNLPIAEALRTICDIKRFSDWEKAARFIKETPSVCFVITAGSNGELLTKEINDLLNVKAVYIFCGNVEYHSSWAKNYSKVLIVENRIVPFVTLINGEICQWQREVSTLRMGFPGFMLLFDDEVKMDFSASVASFENRAQAKRDFIRLARGLSNDKRHIEEFEQTYNQYDTKTILNWYTKESFIYQVTSHCLKKIIGISDSFLYCRLIIKDLSTAIQEQYRLKSINYSGLTYKGTYFSHKEWARFEENIGKDFLMDSFFCTSKEKTKASKFAQQDADRRALVTIIIPYGQITNKLGFVELKEFSDFGLVEDEVLFNIFSTFTILSASTETSEEGKEYRHLTLLYGVHPWREYVHEKNPKYEIKLPEINNLVCSACQVEVYSPQSQPLFSTLTHPHKFICRGCINLFEFNEKQPLLCIPMIQGHVNNQLISSPIQAQGITNRYQGDFNIPFYGYKCSKCKDGKFKLAYKCTTCTKPQKLWCETCFYQDPECMEQGHAIILERQPYSFWAEKMNNHEILQDKLAQNLVAGQAEYQQAEDSFKFGEFAEAIQHYQGFILQNKAVEPPLIAQAYKNMGISSRNLGDYHKALLNLQEALEILKNYYGNINPIISSTYEELGGIYTALGSYQTALDNYQQALKIKESIYGYEHVSIALSYHKLGLAHGLLGEAEEALRNHLEALEINESYYKGWNTAMGDSYHYVGDAYCVMGEYKKAIESHKKGMDHRLHVYGENHNGLASSYESLGMVYNTTGEGEKAVESHLKALEIRKNCEGEQGLSVARSYECLGIVYTKQGDIQKGIENHQKALKIRTEIVGERNPLVGDSYEGLGAVYVKAGDLQKAKGLYEKGLNVKNAVYLEKHPSLGATYENLGNVYRDLKDLNMAIELYGKGIKILEEYHGEKYPGIASCYMKIGGIYTELKEHENAVDSYLKALEVRREAYGEEHHETKESYTQVGVTYLAMSE